MTPTVPTVGRSGCWPITGCADASIWAESGRAAPRTGRDPAMTLAGTEVAAARLAKMATLTLLLIAPMSLT